MALVRGDAERSGTVVTGLVQVRTALSKKPEAREVALKGRDEGRGDGAIDNRIRIGAKGEQAPELRRVPRTARLKHLVLWGGQPDSLSRLWCATHGNQMEVGQRHR